MNEIPNSWNRDCFAEMVVDDPTSLRAKLEWLVDCPEDVTRLGLAGRQRVLQAFTWPAVVWHCLDVYERKSLTGGPKR